MNIASYTLVAALAAASLPAWAGEHPAVLAARGAHPGHQDAMKVYLHPAGGWDRRDAVPAEVHVLGDHPAVQVLREGVTPGHAAAMKVYRHPAQ